MGCRHLLFMKIRVATNIRSNTQKFSSVDELPPDIREMYECAMTGGPSSPRLGEFVL